MNTVDLLLLIAAVWRLSNLVANEDGPYLMFRKLRRKVEKWDKKYRWFRRSYLKEGITCEYCISVWFGVILGSLYLLLGDLMLIIVLPLALSTGAILIKKVVFILSSIDTYYDKLNVHSFSISEKPVDTIHGTRWELQQEFETMRKEVEHE